MRRLISITAFAVILGFPLWAQRGGGHFGGAAGGFSRGGFVPHAGGRFSGERPGMARTFARAPNVARGPYLHDGFRNLHSRFHRDRFRGHNFHFRNNCFGYPCRAGYGYPWWGYDPWLWDWSDNSSNYDDDYNQNLAIANEMNEQSLAEQRMLRQEEAEGDRDVYAPHQAAMGSAQSSGSHDGDPIVSPTMLVFRDRHTEEIRNYAIVSETLWIFTGQRTHKIPLSTLDLAATEKANDDRGVTFTVPAASQGQ